MACARRSSIFQDALGDSDGNKKYFRFSGISRTSPNDLIAVLEREHTAGRNPLSSQNKGGCPPSFQSYPYQEKKTLPKLLLHVSRCRFVADFAPPFLYNPTPGARILTSFSFTGIKNPIQQTRFFFPILLIFFSWPSSGPSLESTHCCLIKIHSKPLPTSVHMVRRIITLTCVFATKAQIGTKDYSKQIHIWFFHMLRSTRGPPQSSRLSTWKSLCFSCTLSDWSKLLFHSLVASSIFRANRFGR